MNINGPNRAHFVSKAMKYTIVISRRIIYTDTNKLFQWLADSVVLKLLMKDEFQSCYFWKKLL